MVDEGKGKDADGQRFPQDPLAEPNLAYRDALTNLHNRRLLQYLFHEKWAELQGEEGQISLIMMDLDGFKAINDNWGHLVGDEVLKAAASSFRQQLRKKDLLIRYGGDEFVVVLPSAGPAEARSLGERIRRAPAVHRHSSPSQGRSVDLQVSLSLGIASYPSDGRTGSELLAVADGRLYEDKNRRRSSARRRLAIGATVLAAAAAVLLMTLQPWQSLQREEPEPPDPVVTQTIVQDPFQTEQILALEERVAALARELDLERSRAQERQDTSRVQELESTIAGLEEELETARVSEEDQALVEASQESRELPQEEAEPRRAETEPDPLPEPELEQAEPVSPELDQTPEPVFTLPRLISIKDPAYPRVARTAKKEAIVELRVVVSKEGQVVSAEPLGDAIGLGFEQAARDAATTARYQPGTRDGIPVQMETRLTIKFQL